MDLQLSYRNLLIDRAMHGTPEPDAAVRATLNRGWKRGTWEGELMRLFTQFKSFPTSIWMKAIGRELKGYGPGENKLRAGAFGIANTIIFGTMTWLILHEVPDTKTIISLFLGIIIVILQLSK